MPTSACCRRRRFHSAVLVTSFGLVLALAVAVFAEELTLKDGTMLRGAVDTPAVLPGHGDEGHQGFIRVDDGLRRVFFHNKKLAHVNENPPLTGIKPFRIPQPLGGRVQAVVIENLMTVVEIKPFDENGRRTYSVRDARGQHDIVQGITEIHPDFVKVQALKYPWESSVATAAIPSDTLEKILRRAIDPKDVDDRLRLVRFFIAMEWFVQAGNELKVIEKEFPRVADQVREAGVLLEEQKLRRRLREIKIRRGAGQHSVSYQLVKDFPLDGAPGDVLTEVRDLLKEYEGMIERMQRVQREIGRLRAEIKDADLREKLSPPLEEVVQWIHVENLTRLENFLSVAGNEELAAEHRLGAAVSGWLVGSALAEPNADRAVRLWDARGKILEFLREGNETRRQKVLNELRAFETVSVDLAAHIVELMPPVIPNTEVEKDKPTVITVKGGGNRSIEYSVLLPPEYNPFRSYPVIVTLHAANTTPDQQIAWWSSSPAFHASRQGYIVVAPSYIEDPKQGYRYDVASHDAVLYSLIDLRRRFSVDSDRVFLTGYSMGGHAAWDIGLAHPDLFAGVMPICGSPQFYCDFYWQNSQQASFYIVDGEKNGGSPDANMKLLKRMMENGHDAVYVEYRGRGHEAFSDETLKLFEWMSKKTRKKFPLSFACRSSRPTDNEFYYVSVDDFDPNVMMDPRVFDAKKIRTAQLDGKITGTANSIQIKLQGPKQAELWLSPGMVDLNQPVTVRVNGDIKHRKMVTLSLEALLEDFRARADRQKLFYAKMSFPRL